MLELIKLLFLLVILVNLPLYLFDVLLTNVVNQAILYSIL